MQRHQEISRITGYIFGKWGLKEIYTDKFIPDKFHLVPGCLIHWKKPSNRGYQRGGLQDTEPLIVNPAAFSEE